MIINELYLANFRGYETAKFTFQPGINLIAGLNRAAKFMALRTIGGNSGSTVTRLGGVA